MVFSKIYNVVVSIVFTILAILIPYNGRFDDEGKDIWGLAAMYPTFFLILALATIILSISILFLYRKAVSSGSIKMLEVINCVIFFIAVVFYFSICVQGIYANAYSLPSFFTWIIVLFGMSAPIVSIVSIAKEVDY